MKVLVLSSFTTSLFWFRIDMMKSFLEAGCQVVAVGNDPEEDWEPRFRALGIRYRSIPVERNGTNPLRDLKTLRAIRKLLREEKPDRIFAYQAKTVIYGGIAAGLGGFPHFYPMIAGVGSVFLGSGLKNRVIRSILITEYRMALRHARRVFFQNQDDLGVFVSNRIVKKDKTVMVHGSGVNVRTFTPTPLPAQQGFLCISRLIRDKGVCEYLEAARKLHRLHPDVKCVLVGPFDTNPSAITPEALRPYQEDGSVEYMGEQSDVQPFLRACTAYILPSYHEGTPKTVLEAMACGRPVITTDAPGCRETISDGKNGYLVPVRDVDAIVAAMERLLADPERTQEMARQARTMAEEIFDVCKVNQTIGQTMEIEE